MRGTETPMHTSEDNSKSTKQNYRECCSLREDKMAKAFFSAFNPLTAGLVLVLKLQK